ncbi:MAG TPA: hypothetical protein VFB72_01915 [Verrucomicrobiae bacterium]|nr:hypothetical protein [Verrucomicrobiae bacterium]
MKNVKILLPLLLSCLAGQMLAQSLPEQYAQYGKLIIAKLDSAPFPHPDRAQGHKYHDEFYDAAKHYSDNSVAIFVPKGFHPAEKVDFVVHFHGWRHHIENTLAEYNLIPQFVDSGRNAILIVPQGAKDTPDSFGGKLEDEGGFARFMADVMETLRKQGVITTSGLGSIILSGHSGGYQVISSIVDKGGLSENVKEVWLLDALYARREQFMGWFTKFPERRFIDIYTLHGGTKEETEALMQWAKEQHPPLTFIQKNEPDITESDLRDNRFIFIYSPLPHDQVVFKNNQFREFLKTSCLKAEN